MRIVLFQQHPLEILPPLISLMRILKELGHEICYIGLTDTQSARETLNELGVKFAIYDWKIILFRDHPFVRIWRELTKRIRHLLFRRWAWVQIGKFCDIDNDDVIIWSQSMISAAILGDRALKLGKRHVVTLYDLGDEAGRDLSGFDMSALYRSATLVECEYNRAHILMAEKLLDRLPFVLPNKPYPHPRKRDVRIEDHRAAEVVKAWGGKKVFLYQGALQRDRGDLFKMIDILCRACPDAIIAAMGRENETTKALQAKYKNFSFVPFVAPPHHLEVTSHAHIGLAVYKGGAIYGLAPANAVYCAPNKIFEYSGYGMPMLCNDIPGLRYTVGHAGAAECIEDVTEESVARAARSLIDHYDDYSRKATEFFESVDTVSIVKKILDFARGVR